MIKISHLNIFFIFILTFQVTISLSYAQVKIDGKSIPSLHNVSDKNICYYLNSNKRHEDKKIAALKEAKKRGICGFAKVSSNTKPLISLNSISDENICESATYISSKDYKLRWHGRSFSLKYVREAKRRGLKCGVVERIRSNKQLKENKKSIEIKKINYKKLELSQLEKLSKEGNLFAKYVLVRKYLYGPGKPVNTSLSVKMLIELSREGFLGASFQLAKLYKYGTWVNKKDEVLSNNYSCLETKQKIAQKGFMNPNNKRLSKGCSVGPLSNSKLVVDYNPEQKQVITAFKDKPTISSSELDSERQKLAQLEREQRLKAEQEKNKKKAEAERKKKIEEEKRRKKKLAKEKARKKKLVEQERKRKLAQEKLNKKIINYKSESKYFYKDIEDFVKNGGDIDLVNLYKLYNIKPNPKNKWGKSELSQYENLRNFMSSNPQFVSYERERIGKRLKNSFAMKDQSIADLNNNLSELKTLMRKMFGSKEIPKIMNMISDIETTLNDFNQSTANKVLKQSSTYIASKFPKPKIQKKTVSITTDDWKMYKSQTTPQQQQFCTLTKRFFKDLQKAKISRNEIMVNMVHKERQENLDALIPQGNISNWIFKVIKIDQVQDGSAAVILSLPCKSFIGSGQVHTKNTWIKKSEKEWRATIPYNDRRFRELAKLAKGEFVLASGILLEVKAFKPGQIETFYASQQIGEHPLTKGLNLEGELFIADLSYIAALN